MPMSVSSSVDIDPLDELDELVDSPRSVLPSASPWFVAFCMVVISGSVAALLYLRAGLDVAESGWIGLAALLIMVLAEFYSARARERSAVEAELQEVVRISAGFRDEIAALNERISDVEGTMTVRIDDMIEERVETIVADMQSLDERIEALGETVTEFVATPGAAAPDTVPPRIYAPVPDGAVQREPAAPDVPDTPDPDVAARNIDIPAGTFEPKEDAAGDIAEEPVEASKPEVPWAFPGMTEAEAAAMIKGAVEEHGPDIHLQSIVTLPQRRVRFYESLARLRTDDGRSLTPAQFIPVAEDFGIMPIIDNAVLFRSVQILRKISRKNNEVGVFCNISARSLSDSDFFEQFIEFMGENRELAGTIVFEFAQDAFDDLGPVEIANLAALVDLGYRFSIDNVTRLDLDGASLSRHGVRYVKVDAATLMNPPRTASAHIHAADLAAFLARHGITLIATRIESESQVVDILDYDVKFGQGNLFAPPRLVRADVAQSARRGVTA